VIWTRREFLIRTSGGLALAATPLWNGFRQVGALRVAIVGLGDHGCQHLAAGDLPGIDIVRLCDIDIDALRGAARDARRRLGRAPESTTTIDDVVGDPRVDVVVVAVPRRARACVAEAALDSGKHVYCEPPWSLDDTESEALLVTADRRDRLLWQGPATPGWPADVVDEFLSTSTAISHDVHISRSAHDSSDESWPIGWVDPLVALTGRSAGLPELTRSVAAPGLFGRLADAAFARGTGERIVLHERPIMNRAMEMEWTVTVDRGRQSAELWIGARAISTDRDGSARALAGWSSFLQCVDANDVERWRRVGAAQHNANQWWRTLRGSDD
jgi:hypothetical protein